MTHPTDHSPDDDTPAEPGDDMASAALDGALDPAEAARLVDDPALVDRREQLRLVALRVGEPVDPLDPATVDRLVARALAASHDTAEGGAPSPPTPLAPRRPSAPPRRVPPVLVAAALLVAFAIGIGLVLSGQNDDADQLTQVGSSLDAAAVGETEQGADAAAGSAEARSAEVVAVDLGDHDDEAALRAVLAEVDPTTLRPPGAATADEPTTTAAADGSETSSTDSEVQRALPLDPQVVDRCTTAVRGVPGRELGETLAVGVATVDDRQVLVISSPVLGEEGAPTQLTIVDRETCTILSAVQR